MFVLNYNPCLFASIWSDLQCCFKVTNSSGCGFHGVSVDGLCPGFIAGEMCVQQEGEKDQEVYKNTTQWKLNNLRSLLLYLIFHSYI